MFKKATFTDEHRLYTPVPKIGDEVEDVWDVCNEKLEEDPHSKSWSERTTKERTLGVLLILLKLCLVLGSLYLFVCSLSFLSDAFKILSGKTAGSVFTKSTLLSNPIVGLMIGVLVTVLVQSSSTSTSIIVAMVAAEIMPIEPAIYLVMGANIGTTVTNTIVSLGQSMDKRMFRRAFAGATVHDCFNWLCVAILLPLEYIAHPLRLLSDLVVKDLQPGGHADKKKLDFLKKITSPFTKAILEVNKDLIKDIAQACSLYGDDSEECKAENDKSMIKECFDELKNPTSCGFLFSNTGMGDTWTGVITLILALLLLCGCLTVLVKTLQSLLLGRLAHTLKRHINSDLPYPFSWLTGYMFMAVGVGMTILVQSSSVFTSTLTPLVGMGVISVDRMFPLTLGSNIGTTATAMLAAFAAETNYELTIQIAVCHLFFNIFGITLFFPIPFMRAIPIAGSKILGNTTAEYRWFAIAYLLIVFLLIPVVLIALSFNTIVFIVVITLVVITILMIVSINLGQKYFIDRLPPFLKDWTFLPEPMRSLAPYDRFLMAGFTLFQQKFRKTAPESKETKKVESVPLPTIP